MSEWSAWGPCITGEQEGVKDEGTEATYAVEATEGHDIGEFPSVISGWQGTCVLLFPTF